MGQEFETKARRKRDWFGWAYFAFLLFGAPISIASLFLGANSGTIVIAYAIWIGMLAAWTISGKVSTLATGRRSSTTSTEQLFGWAIIIAMFLTIPAITLITIGLLIVGAD